MRRMTCNTIRDFPESRSDLKCFLFLQYKDGGAHEGSRTRRLWLWLQYQSSWGLDMSRLSLSNERSGANCGMWSPTLQYLYGVSFQVIICIIQTTKGHMWQNSRNNRVNEISHRWWMTFFVSLHLMIRVATFDYFCWKSENQRREYFMVFCSYYFLSGTESSPVCDQIVCV